MSEIKKVQVVEQKNGETTPAKSAEAKKAEETSMLSDIISGAQTTVGYIKEYSGWNALTKAQDRSDERLEMWTKNTNGLAYIPVLAGEIISQPTDVTSYVNEKITDQTEKVDSAVEEVAQSTTSDAGKAGTDLLKAFASPLKLVNGVLNIGGGSSDVVSHYAKGGELTNNMIKESTVKTQKEIADSLKDFSIANINDKKTVIDVATRLGFTEEQLAAYEKEHGTDGVRALIQKEYDAQLATGKITRETVLMTAANAAQEKLVEKNADLLVHQKDEGVDKLDKGQKQVREAVSEALNIGGATLDLVNSGIHEGVKAIAGETAGETAAEIADAPLQAVSGFLQTITTSFDGKDGTTQAAIEKMTFGLYKADTAEEKALKAEISALEDDLDAKEDVVDNLTDEIEDLQDELDEAKNGSSGFLGIGAKNKDEAKAIELEKTIQTKTEALNKAKAEMILAQIALATKENDEDDIAEANVAKDEFEKAHPGLLATVAEGKKAEPKQEKVEPKTLTLEEVKAEFIKENNAQFQEDKKAAMLSDEAILSRAKEIVEAAEEKALAPIIKELETEPRVTKKCGDLIKQLHDTKAKLAANHDKAVAAVAKNLTPEVMKQRMADAEAAALKLKQDGKIVDWDANRQAKRAENEAVAKREDGTTNQNIAGFWNEMNKTYSNKDGLNGDIGPLSYGWHFIKGALLTPLSALTTEGVSTVNKYIGTIGCFKVAAISSAYNAAKKTSEAIDEIVNNPYNSAAQKSGAAKFGEGTCYATVSGLTFTYGNHNHLIDPHFKGWCCDDGSGQIIFRSDCDVLIKNPAGL